MKYNDFVLAKPVWAHGRQTEKNLTLSFKTSFSVKENSKITIRITASSVYRLFVNDNLVSYGPARAAHGFYRVDVADMSPYIKKGVNIAVIEVAGYNVNSYYLLDQPAFLQAELLVDDKIVMFTSPDCETLEVRELTERVQKVQRYSFQRPFIEYYRLNPLYQEWKQNPLINKNDLLITIVPGNKLIERGICLSSLTESYVKEQVSDGSVEFDIKRIKYVRDRSLTKISTKLKGFKQRELDIHLSDELQETKFTRLNADPILLTDKSVLFLDVNTYRILDFGNTVSGFIKIKVNCDSACTLYLCFDEILIDGDVDINRFSCCNAVRYDLVEGSYDLLTFEPYVLKYLKLIVKGGACKISDISVIEYESGVNINAVYNTTNTHLTDIYNAAIRTFKHNTTDLYMDCPSRERAGWLCDSFFIGRAEHALTGESTIEKNFLENYLLPEKFDHIPNGMLPMCYPADHNDGCYIPNWALWLIIELEEYMQRNGDKNLVMAFKEKIYRLLEYFNPFLNEDGLLEKLDGWVFIEWSKANDLVQDVNYPTNMLYSSALAAAGRLYDDKSLIAQSAAIISEILKQSYDGSFFVDNAVRVDKSLILTGERTEVCQYYAFFFNIATPDSHPKLFETLLADFGSDRKENNNYPEIHFANSFIGNYLRLDILSRYGYSKKVLEDIEGYFYSMARRTGTLWELDTPVSSCDHGFTSVVTYWLLKHQKDISDKN